MAKKPMTMQQWEASQADAKIDKKMGYKEGSKADNAADKKNLAKYNSKTTTKSAKPKAKVFPTAGHRGMGNPMSKPTKSGGGFFPSMPLMKRGASRGR